MFTWRQPSNQLIHRQIAAQAELDFTYEAVGATAATAPKDFTLDHTRIRLGEGQAVFAAAAQALREWRQFELGWIEAMPRDTPLETGNVVAVVARALGIYSCNFARIVYTLDDTFDGVRRFGFAYGTLPDHVESGEERFLIEWDTMEGSVYYDILAFSRPRHVIARLGYPLVRRMQRRFGRDSTAAMLRIVRANSQADLNSH
jgi:uncharacterized protein (UPF0548 family)